MSGLRTLDEAMVQTRERMIQVDTQIAAVKQWRDQATPEDRDALDQFVLERLDRLNHEAAALVDALRDQERIYAAKLRQHVSPDAGKGDQG